MANYRELYELALRLHFEEKARFNRIDQKASWYFSALTFLVAAGGFFGKWLAEELLPSENTLEVFLLLVGAALLGAIGASWCFLVRVLRVARVANIPLNDQVFALYGKHSDPTIYWAMSQSMRQFRNTNIRTTDRKARMLVKAYKTMIFSLALAALFGLLYGSRLAMQESQRGGDCTVSSEQTDQPQDQDQEPTEPADAPEPSVEQPDTSTPLVTPQYLTEGWTPDLEVGEQQNPPAPETPPARKEQE